MSCGERSLQTAGSPGRSWRVGARGWLEPHDLIIDLGQRRVTRAGSDIPLPHLSFQLLVTLAHSAPDVVTFDLDPIIIADRN